jgi:glutathione synthase/RimK-type ligase-like ATP-grasp enzyme
MAFHRAGCVVEAVCPPEHPVFVTHALQASYRYRALAPLHSLRSAILRSQPELVVPCDDLVMMQLHQVFGETANVNNEEARFLRECIRVSMGDPAGLPIAESQEQLMAVAREEGIRTPQTQPIDSVDALEQWIAQYGLPAVLKADGTSGGEGVLIARTLAEATRAFHTLQAPVSTAVVAKSTCLDGDWNRVLPWLRQHGRAVGIQSFVSGPDANIAIACWQGKVLASISAEVLKTWRPKGPATLLRLVDNAEMLEAAVKIVRRLNFSGLCGFDFILDEVSGAPWLIEMNARATQTCALPLGPGKDLVAALCAAATGEPAPEQSVDLQNDVVALFPLAWQTGIACDLFQSAYQDIPWEEPDLIQLGLRQVKNSSRRDKLAKRLSGLRPGNH